VTVQSCLYAGQVYHKRFRPREHVLRYSVFSMLIDLEDIDQLDSRLRLFSHNRFNLFGINDSDFGENKNEPLISYVRRKLLESGIHTIPTQILLSCYPRVLGYVFNPLSLFYCLNEHGRCIAIVHEVHNTFGERHAYVLPVEQDLLVDNQNLDCTVCKRDESSEAGEASYSREIQQTGAWIHQQAEKEIFVSPFAHMGLSYRFRLNLPQEKQVVVIRVMDEQGILITASYTAQRHRLSNVELARFFCKIPLLTIKVITGIHWEALRLWIKGVTLFKHHSFEGDY
jgi:DUF1365 family protein